MARAKLKVQAPKQETLHVVVVGDHRTEGDVIESGLSTGQFACFIGTNQAAVIAKAREESRRWGESRVDFKPYRLLVGEIVGVAEFPVSFTIKAL